MVLLYALTNTYDLDLGLMLPFPELSRVATLHAAAIFFLQQRAHFSLLFRLPGLRANATPAWMTMTLFFFCSLLSQTP